VDPGADHPDRAILEVLEAVGLKFSKSADGVRVEGRPTRGLQASGAAHPDLLPTLAAFACVLPGPSILTDVGILRHKESNRLEGICEMVAAAGGSTALDGEVLTLKPPEFVRPFALSTRSDHRMAMSAATLAALSRVPVQLDDASCVSKSFPGFWKELEKVGVSLW
jgi:3-phosphoshikimate 1-carboxyvinyltransferase